MAQFEKTYIGKGSKVKDLDIIRISISRETLEELLKNHMVDFEGKEYLVFEVAALKEETSTEKPTQPTSAKRWKCLRVLQS